MTKEEAKQYAREYRAEGFGRINDHRYYLRHREEVCAKNCMRYLAKKGIYRKNVVDVEK